MRRRTSKRRMRRRRKRGKRTRGINETRQQRPWWRSADYMVKFRRGGMTTQGGELGSVEEKALGGEGKEP